MCIRVLDSTILQKDVENNPEYWQEIKEGDYQIMSFTATNV